MKRNVLEDGRKRSGNKEESNEMSEIVERIRIRNVRRKEKERK